MRAVRKFAHTRDRIDLSAWGDTCDLFGWHQEDSFTRKAHDLGFEVALRQLNTAAITDCDLKADRL